MNDALKTLDQGFIDDLTNALLFGAKLMTSIAKSILLCYVSVSNNSCYDTVQSGVKYMSPKVWLTKLKNFKIILEMHLSFNA